MSKSVIFNSDGQHPSSPVSTPLLDIDIVAQIVSSSGKKRATLRNVKLADGKSNRIVEVWSEGLLQISLNVTDYHGDFYTDGEFTVGTYRRTYMNDWLRVSWIALFCPFGTCSDLYSRRKRT
jgi:hypothetical protein